MALSLQVSLKYFMHLLFSLFWLCDLMIVGGEGEANVY
jgi:hypothetical protein